MLRELPARLPVRELPDRPSSSTSGRGSTEARLRPDVRGMLGCCGKGPPRSAPKVVRTRVITVRDHNDDTDVGVARMLGDDGYEPDDPIVILPAADFDRMVERLAEAERLLRVAKDTGLDDGIRAFLAETKCTCPSDEDVAGVWGGDVTCDYCTLLAGEKGASDGK